MRPGTPVWLLVLVGCAPSPAHPLPRYPIDAAWARQTDAPRAVPDASSPTMTLGEAFELALKINESIELAQRGITTADIQNDTVTTELTPYIKLTGVATVQREVISPITQIATVPGHQLGSQVSVSQPIFRRDFAAGRTAAARGQESAAATYKRARQQLERDVTGAFIDVVRTRKLLKLANDAVDRAQVQEQLATARVKVGQSLRTAELLTEIELARSQRLAVTAEHDVAAAEVEFQRLVGRLPPAELVLPALPVAPEPQRGLEIAMTRDDLVALELQFQQAQALEQVSAQHRWWPLLDLNASAQVQNPDIFGHAYTWAVTGLLTVPLLQNGTELVDLANHQNATHIARLEADQQRKVIVEQVQVAAEQIAVTVRAAELAEKQRDAARENYKLVDKQVRLGAITSLEVTNAQAVLTEAESAFEVATMDRTLAIYQYLFAIGTLDLTSSTAAGH